MNKILKSVVVISSLLGSTAALAAKPTSVTFIESLNTADGVEYAYYQVKCSNGSILDVSAWDKRKLWCPGKGLKDDCSKKQIKVAKKVCKGA